MRKFHQVIKEDLWDFVQGVTEELWKRVPGLTECLPSSGEHRIADSIECDVYYICVNGQKSEQQCPDGTAFDFETQFCISLTFADCTGRQKLRQSSANKSNRTSIHCKWENGLFPHEDPKKCNEFYQCDQGKAVLKQCPESLLFNTKNLACDFPFNVDTSKCQFSDLLVKCPGALDADTTVPVGLQNRVPDPNDCRRYYLCERNKPWSLSCEDGQAFDPKKRICVDQELLPHCH